MKRRLRKRKHIGEFQEFGFEVMAYLNATVEEAHPDAFVQRFIAFVEARNLAFGGGIGDGQVTGFVSRFGRGSATDDDRRALAAFLEHDEAISRHDLSALRDAWHD